MTATASDILCELDYKMSQVTL